jgi:hypothetical protein
MGLDMYLRANQYVSRWDYDGNNADDNNPLFDQLVKQFDVADAIGDTTFGGISVDFPMGYWRKVNSVHNWFVKNCGGGVDECQNMYVNRQHLEELKSLCEQVLADHSLAEELLPTSAGFFFGSTDFDQYYYTDLEYTVKVIDRCLKSKFDYFEYQASW